MDKFEAADKWLDKIHREFKAETDRGAAIVAAAMLDEALRGLIESVLVPAPNQERCILNRYDAPLGSFGARIDAAFQLGLISRYLAKDLHVVRRIRNEFAHVTVECMFETQSMRHRIEALVLGSSPDVRDPETRAAIGAPGPRHDFLSCVAWMLYALRIDSGRAAPSEQHPEFGYLDLSALPPELQKYWDDLDEKA